MEANNQSTQTNAQVSTKNVQENFKNIITANDDVIDALESYVIPVNDDIADDMQKPVGKDDKKETTNINEQEDDNKEPVDFDEEELTNLIDDEEDSAVDLKNDKQAKDKQDKKETPLPIDKTKQLDILSELLTPEQKKELLNIKSKEEIEKKTYELVKENMENLKKDTLVSFYESLPEEAQMLIQYALNDGTDIKGFIRSLMEDNPGYEVDKMSDEMVVRNYLKSKNFNDEDIDEQIALFRASGSLNKKATKYRDELRKDAELKSKEKLKAQEEIKKKKEEYSKWYVDELNKIITEFPKDIQKDIIKGLVQSDKKSISGHPINELYYLLEKYQIKEPNLKLVGEALWLLRDPESYKNTIKEKYKNEILDQELKKHLKKSTEKITNKANTYVDDTTSRSSEGYKYQPSRNKNISTFKNILFGE